VNAVVYYNFGHINGCLFDAFEYYIELAKHGDALFFIVTEKEYLKEKNNIFFYDILEIFKDRYAVDIPYQNIIDIDDRRKLLKKSREYKLKNVLIVDEYTPQAVLSYIYAKHFYILVELYLDTQTDYKRLARDVNKHIFSEALLYKSELAK